MSSSNLGGRCGYKHISDLSTYPNMPDLICVETGKEGAAGVEPATSRSAVECSTTELYPHICPFNISQSNFVNY